MESTDDLSEGILSGDTLSLARAITLVESNKPNDRIKAIELINGIYDGRSDSIRLGITGIPGVGKSTFIEKLGLSIANSGLKIAVLAIDPSSARSSGSILGDKTRMEELSKHPNAFIRPSPSGGTLGGVAAKTRESLLLCEAAGFDVVIVETVGVGQSEIEVINITDTFLMLAMPGTGDELQGIKRGIMETADVIVINKADGDNVNQANKAKKQLEMALHLFPEHESGWRPKVMKASALNDQGISECWQMLQNRQNQILGSGWLNKMRKAQQQKALESLTSAALYAQAMKQFGAEDLLNTAIKAVNESAENEYGALLYVMKQLNR